MNYPDVGGHHNVILLDNHSKDIMEVEEHLIQDILHKHMEDKEVMEIKEDITREDTIKDISRLNLVTGIKED